MIMFFLAWSGSSPRCGSGFSVRLLSRSKVVPGVHVLRQQTLPRSARWWEVVSPVWSFWRWILWAGDLKGLE
jgi:hypothetical protein